MGATSPEVVIVSVALEPHFVEFAKRAILWEIPIVESITKLDARRRGIFPAPFQPGDVMVPEYHDNTRVTFRLLQPADVPVAKSVKKKGMTLVKAAGVSREKIAGAIRAERDAR